MDIEMICNVALGVFLGFASATLFAWSLNMYGKYVIGKIIEKDKDLDKKKEKKVKLFLGGIKNERKNDEVCIGEIPEGNGVPLCRECVW